MRGRSIRFSLCRRVVDDGLYFAKQMPTVPVERRMDLSRLRIALREVDNAPNWSAIFLKGFALVAREMPELCRVYLPWPRPHLYEYPVSIGVLPLEREHDEGETGLFPYLISNPAARSLLDITADIRHAKDAPWRGIKQFRRMLAVARLPRLLRRTLWGFGFNVGRFRSRYFGTFLVTTVGPAGASTMHPIAPVTTTIGYGQFLAGGNIDVRGIFDHRVLDGLPMARALVRLDEVLNNEILNEIRTGAASTPAKPCNLTTDSKPQ
jgi:hypothetical protein